MRLDSHAKETTALGQRRGGNTENITINMARITINTARILQLSPPTKKVKSH
jgi:hypothetical protein